MPVLELELRNDDRRILEARRHHGGPEGGPGQEGGHDTGIQQSSAAQRRPCSKAMTSLKTKKADIRKVCSRG